MPPVPRKPRNSLPTPSGLEDISHLSLADIQARLERNQRVLGSSLFSTSPTASTFSTSPTTTRNPFSDRSSASPSAGGDPVRDRLVVARQALLAREQELLLEQGITKLEVTDTPHSPLAESSADGRRRSSGQGVMGGAIRSGKARAMESIKVVEGELDPNGIILPYDQSLALGEREFDKATADRMANMAIHTPPLSAPSTPSRRRKHNPTDEIARAQANARARAFMGYKSARNDDDDYDDDGDGDGDAGDGFFEEDWGMEGEYDGDGDKFALGRQGREGGRREKGTGEEVDGMGEDDEAWAEGNEDYLDRVR